MDKATQEAPGFQFPCAYQIKAMGRNDGRFTDVVVDIIGQHCAQVDHHSVVSKPSRNGKYLSVSITIEAHSHAHLDNLYAALTAHEKVLMRL